MSERKKIDRLFQEKFKDFEAEPSELAWEKIEARLEEKEDRKVIPFWFKLTGVAAVLILGLLLALNYKSDKAANEGTNVVSVPGKTEGTKRQENLKSPGKIDDSNGGNQKDAVVSSDGNQSGANASPKAETAGEKSGLGLTPKSQNVSGVRSTDKAVAAGQSESQRKNVGGNGKQSRVRKNTVTRSLEDAEQQYASSDKSRRANRNGAKTTQSSPQSVADNAGTKRGSRVGKSNRQAIGENASTNKKPGIQSEENQSVADNVSNKNRNRQNEFNTNRKIAVNENNQSGKTDQKDAQVTENTTTSTQAVAAKTDDTKKDSTALAMADEPNALEKLQNEKENKSVTQNEPRMNRWQITSKVAPIYSSSASSGSPIDSRFAQNNKEYKTKLSYGMGVSYALNKKLSVRAGVNSLSFETNTTGVVAEQSFVGRQQLEHVKPSVQGAFLRINNKSGIEMTEVGLNEVAAKRFDGSISQKTGYLEVPVELSYKVLDKRFGVDVIGGFSTLFLNQNEVSVVTSSSEMQVGKASNLNETSFSGNLGLGVRYNIWKALQVNVEPMFKYQFNTYTESGNYKPYFFGIYTGLNYRF